MSTVRDTLSPLERAEFDRLVALLPVDERPLVRIVELFMLHQLAQAAMLNEEIRELVARQSVDLVDHEVRLQALEVAR